MSKSKTTQPVIKWTGSKRSQAEEILKHIGKFAPCSCSDFSSSVYYEPFIGGGSVMRRILDEKMFFNFKRIECSDLNGDLISLWNMIKDKPVELADAYEEMWKEFNSKDIDYRKEYFNKIRHEFNTNGRKPEHFLFISRTATNGLIRYNSDNQYNNSCHFSRSGIMPSKLRDIIFDWSDALNENNVLFFQRSYDTINPLDDDVCYCDPPYSGVSSGYTMYLGGGFDQKKFFDWLRSLKCSWFLSYDGKAGEIDNTYAVPKDLYDEHIYIKSGNSSFRRVIGKTNADVYESLYIKRSKLDE